MSGALLMPETRAPATSATARIRHGFVELRDGRAWRAALVGIPHGYAHSHGHAMALQASLATAPRLYVGDHAAGRVVCPFVVRDDGIRDAYTPYGFGGFTANVTIADFVREWTGFARTQGFVSAYVALNPVFVRPEYVAGACVKRTHDVYFLDLRAGPARLREGCARSIADKLQRFDRADPEIVTDRRVLAVALPELYAATCERVAASAAYAFTPRTLAAWVNDPDVLALGVRRHGRIEAMSLFGCTPYCADYLLNAATDAGREWSAGLIWRALLVLAARRVRYLNLGGGVTNGDGLARFKARFGARVVALGALHLVCDGPRYTALTTAPVRAPVAVNDYFPAYRRRDE